MWCWKCTRTTGFVYVPFCVQPSRVLIKLKHHKLRKVFQIIWFILSIFPWALSNPLNGGRVPFERRRRSCDDQHNMHAYLPNHLAFFSCVFAIHWWPWFYCIFHFNTQLYDIRIYLIFVVYYLNACRTHTHTNIYAQVGTGHIYKYIYISLDDDGTAKTRWGLCFHDASLYMRFGQSSKIDQCVCVRSVLGSALRWIIIVNRSAKIHLFNLFIKSIQHAYSLIQKVLIRNHGSLYFPHEKIYHQHRHISHAFVNLIQPFFWSHWKWYRFVRPFVQIVISTLNFIYWKQIWLFDSKQTRIRLRLVWVCVCVWASLKTFHQRAVHLYLKHSTECRSEHWIDLMISKIAVIHSIQL